MRKIFSVGLMDDCVSLSFGLLLPSSSHKQGADDEVLLYKRFLQAVSVTGEVFSDRLNYLCK